MLRLCSLGCADPTLFSSPGDSHNVAELREIFNSGPDYGEDFSFTGTDYTVYDAARLILLYLDELPKPLVSRSVVKSWVLLARQEGAIEPPCRRIETGLDFWAEALNRLPAANRNLTKHLLNLFASLLLRLARPVSPPGARSINEADARRLASSVSRALFHSDRGKSKDKNGVFPTLALAFLISKRGDYVGEMDIEGETRAPGLSKPTLSSSTSPSPSRKCRFRKEADMFLPSHKEISMWKGGHW